MCALTAQAPLVTTTPSELAFQAARAAYASKDYERAFAQARSAADAGHVAAMRLAGHMLEAGLGVDQDETAAAEYYRRAAQRNDPDALYSLGLLGLESRGGVSKPEAESFLSRAGRAGDAAAAEALGYALLSGEIGRLDVNAAALWLARAADAGRTSAAYPAALLFTGQDGADIDYARARKYLEQAGTAGVGAAAADLGLLLMQGRFGAPDAEGAARWFERAASYGDQEGQFLYAYTLATGSGTMQNLEAAYGWVLRSAAQGRSSDQQWDADRVRLQTALEQTLPPDALARIRTEVSAPPLAPPGAPGPQPAEGSAPTPHPQDPKAAPPAP